MNQLILFLHKPTSRERRLLRLCAPGSRYASRRAAVPPERDLTYIAPHTTQTRVTVEDEGMKSRKRTRRRPEGSGSLIDREGWMDMLIRCTDGT